MITHIRVGNFKSWADRGAVKLAPLTGFFGTNSSGKSSLLQMLLLLKQTVGSEKVIFFGDENSLVNLGDFREVIHGHKEDALLRLEFACRLTHHRPIDNTPEHDSPGQQKQRIDQFTFESIIRKEQGKTIVERLIYSLTGKAYDAIKYSKGSVSFLSPDSLFLQSSDEEEINQHQVELNTCYGKTSSVPGAAESVEVLSTFSSAFEELFSHVYYLGPTRVHPQRRYHWEGTHPDSLGQRGEEMIAALLSARIDQRTTPYAGKEVPIEARISVWLQEMDLAYSFSLGRPGAKGHRNYEVRIQKSADSPEVTLVDMGYGLAQFLPVLVLCYYAPEGSMLILEQPGIHLHPKVQAQLADLLIEVVTERYLQILVESHSEHLLTRLQLRIAEEKIPVSKTALYFCENEGGISTIKSLDLDALGNIKNWPKNFFGNVRGDLVKMTREQMKRQKKTEG